MGITLIYAQQIIIVDLDYNISLSNHVEKRISWIRQTNKLIADILICTDVKIGEEIKKRYNER